jgi:hypothetical protein
VCQNAHVEGDLSLESTINVPNRTVIELRHLANRLKEAIRDLCLYQGPSVLTAWFCMSSRPWLDAIENPEVEQELQQTAVAQAPSAPKKKLPPNKRVHLWAAAIRNGRLPDRDDFVRVGCVQMSGQGATFLWPGAYPHDLVMIAIGTVNKAYYLQSTVVSKIPQPNGDTKIVCSFHKRW